MKKIKNNIILIFLLIIINTSLIIHIINKRVIPSMTQIVTINLENEIYRIANDYKMLTSTLSSNKNIVNIMTNSKGDIIAMNYDTEKIYDIASNIGTYLLEKITKTSKVSSLSYSIIPKDNKMVNGIILNIPLGLITNYPFLSNLGPKIPINVQFKNTFFTQVNTKVTDYGINNALLEIYLNIKIDYEIIGIKDIEQHEINYKLLLDSRVVQGNIPEWYAKSYEKMSSKKELSIKPQIENLQ